MVWILNAPFVAFAFVAMGRSFGAKTLVVSAVLGAAIGLVNRSLIVSEIFPAVSAIGGGTLLGTGILLLARHNASLGGTGAVVLWLQRRYGLNAGVGQLAIDTTLFVVASALLPSRTPPALPLYGHGLCLLRCRHGFGRLRTASFCHYIEET